MDEATAVFKAPSEIREVVEYECTAYLPDREPVVTLLVAPEAGVYTVRLDADGQTMLVRVGD